MLDKIRSIVSGDKIRYCVGEFNLDLTYITDNVIAMGFPASGMEGTYRNNIENVARMLNATHPAQYLIFNLTEREYDYSRFDNQVLEFPFPDHHPPSLPLLFRLLTAMDGWLSADPKNIVAVHCLAGRGRTGTVICCYLMLSLFSPDIKDAIMFFGARRSLKDEGVTNPGQLRYINYFNSVIRTPSLTLNRDPLLLHTITISPLPSVKPFKPLIEVFDMGKYSPSKPPKLLYSSDSSQYSNHSLVLADSVSVRVNTRCRGDLKIVVHNIAKKTKPVQLFRVSFNTAFLEANELVLPRSRIDGVHKDTDFVRFPPDFTLTANFRSLDDRLSREEDDLDNDLLFLADEVRAIFKRHGGVIDESSVAETSVLSPSSIANKKTAPIPRRYIPSPTVAHCLAARRPVPDPAFEIPDRSPSPALRPERSSSPQDLRTADQSSRESLHPPHSRPGSISPANSNECRRARRTNVVEERSAASTPDSLF